MESTPAAKTKLPSENPEPAIAIQDRLVAMMFLAVGLMLGALILVDLFAGLFR